MDRRLGLTPPGADVALLECAGRLDSTRPFHRAVAWAMLLVFGLPVIFYVIRLVQDVTGQG